MSGGIQKLCEQLADLASSQALMAFENWSDGITSPIERLMLIGMYSVIPHDEIALMPLLKFEVISTDKSHPMQVARAAEHGTLVIQPQYRLLDWPADFVLSCPSISQKRVVIECDGHDFHERTKEQAARDRARDRAVQAQGHIMLRYTGSEIYRDPLGCARNALKTLANAIEPEWFAGLDLK
jgi:very-short-patch-repair endonuclease